MENNIKAMAALENNNFEVAQFYFRKVCKSSKSYQAYNNLGIFYIKNGITCKNGKVISGFYIGKRMLEKSLSLHETVKVLNNLCFLEYEIDNFPKAIEYWQRSYELKKDKTILYNISVAMFRLGLYEKSADICLSLESDISKAAEMRMFAICMHNKTIPEKILHADNPMPEIFNCVDKLYLFHYMEKYEEILDLETEIHSSIYGLNDTELAILFYAFVKCGQIERGKTIIKSNYIDQYDSSYGNYRWRYILKMAADLNFLKKTIDACQYIPQIINEECEYFGCILHATSWI